MPNCLFTLQLFSGIIERCNMRRFGVFPPRVVFNKLLNVLRNMTMTNVSNSPYLKNCNRLGDVIAAIQVMGKYGFYKLTFDKWAMRISGDENKGEYWKTIFSDHPEFFRLDTEGKMASLAWRRSYRKRYSVDNQREFSFEEYSVLTNEQKKKVSRTPLTGDEISVLINTAINIHARAIEQNKENRWLSSPLFSLLGVALGALLTFFLK